MGFEDFNNNDAEKAVDSVEEAIEEAIESGNLAEKDIEKTKAKSGEYHAGRGD